ncbi:MAG: radical SAM protein [Phycisphaerales bacterium]|nr:MAG: radical SAM protein [Phycisphaerales bacterium]
MGSRRRFLLLDPPATVARCRRGSLREKGNAQAAPFPSIDLILLSGAVREAGFDPVFVDAQLDDLSWPSLTRRLQDTELAGLVSLVSSANVDAELVELRKLKDALGGVPVYVVSTIILQLDSGSVERIMQANPWLDGMILNPAEHNFSDLIRPDAGGVAKSFNVAVQGLDGPIVPDVTASHGNCHRMPRPEHAIFKDRRYYFPQSRNGPVTCVQMSFGCPFTCEFCVDNQLHHKMLTRDVDDVIEELIEVDRLGFREFYFKDLTFGLKKVIAEDLLTAMVKNRLRFRWLCTTRIDVLTPDLLVLMKRAGCYGVELGVEHPRESVRQRIGKRVSKERIKRVFDECRRLGIETTAFVMLAFEDDTDEDVRDTIRFAKHLNPNYVSFNVVNALPGTPYFQRARREGFLRTDKSDYGFATSNIKHKHLTPEQVEQLRLEAVRSFYLRPSSILKRVAGLRNLFALRKLLRLGMGVFRRVEPCT